MAAEDLFAGEDHVLELSRLLLEPEALDVLARTVEAVDLLRGEGVSRTNVLVVPLEVLVCEPVLVERLDEGSLLVGGHNQIV